MPIYVTVYDYQGSPKAGVKVGLDSPSNPQTTGPDGKVTFASPLIGSHQLYVDGVKSGSPFPFVPPTRNLTCYELVVTVEQSGNPVSGAGVCLDAAGTNCKQTDANGKVSKYGPQGSRTVYVNGSTSTGWQFTLPGSGSSPACLTCDT